MSYFITRTDRLSKILVLTLTPKIIKQYSLPHYLESDFDEFFLMLIDATGRKRDGLADGMIFCPSMSPFKIPTWERLLLLLDIFLFMASIRSFWSSSRGLKISIGFLVVGSGSGFEIGIGWVFDCFISLLPGGTGGDFDSVTVNDAVVDGVVDWIDGLNDLLAADSTT